MAKDPRLKSKIVIDALFVDGKSQFKFPLKCAYQYYPEHPRFLGLQYTVSVSKRSFKKAVDRNKIKRRIREAIRLNISDLSAKIIDTQYLPIMFVYVGKEILDYSIIEKSVISSIIKLDREIERK